MASRRLEGSFSTRSGNRIDGCRHPYVTGPGTESLAYQRAIVAENGTGGGNIRDCLRYRRKRKNPAATHSSLAAAPMAITASKSPERQCHRGGTATRPVAVASVPDRTEPTSTGGVFDGSIAGNSSDAASSPGPTAKR